MKITSKHDVIPGIPRLEPRLLSPRNAIIHLSSSLIAGGSRNSRHPTSSLLATLRAKTPIFLSCTPHLLSVSVLCKCALLMVSGLIRQCFEGRGCQGCVPHGKSTFQHLLAKRHNGTRPTLPFLAHISLFHWIYWWSPGCFCQRLSAALPLFQLHASHQAGPEPFLQPCRVIIWDFHSTSRLYTLYQPSYRY